MFTLKEFLRSEVVPALGCTEPGAVALAVARAREEISSGELKKIDVTTSINIYKNGYSVGIPGTNGLRGNILAAALGAVCGNSKYSLQALKFCDDECLNKALRLIDEGRVELHPDFQKKGVYVQATVTTDEHECRCIIEGTHSNITKIMLDGRLILNKKKRSRLHHNLRDTNIIDQLNTMTFRDVTNLLDNIDSEDIDYIFEGIKMNMDISLAGLDPNQNLGLGVGRTILKLVNDNDISSLPYKIKAHAAAAADARMSGSPLPVMSSAGSGNHGITAILPVYLTAEHYGKTKEETATAVALSHLTTSFLKSRIGRLSPICGCTVAAGAGAAAGITYLLSKDMTKVEEAIKIHLSNLVGMICDGAKGTCALKVGTGAYEAFMAAMMAIEGTKLEAPQGILGNTLEETVENIAVLNNKGFDKVDAMIVKLISGLFC